MTLAENGMELGLLHKVKTLRCRNCLFEVLYVCGVGSRSRSYKGGCKRRRGLKAEGRGYRMSVMLTEEWGCLLKRGRRLADGRRMGKGVTVDQRKQAMLENATAKPVLCMLIKKKFGKEVI